MNSKALAVIAVLAIATTMTFNSTVKNDWEDYKSFYGKSYESFEEDAYRLAIFMKAHAEVIAHNADPTQTYTKGINHFSDLSKDEFKSIYLGWKGYASSVADEDLLMDYGDVNWVTKGAV